jgi:hypothetical protein
MWARRSTAILRKGGRLAAVSNDRFVDSVETRGIRPDQRLARHRGSWVGGLALIAVGALFLLNNSAAWQVPQSAWALPLLIAAAGGAFAALRMWRSGSASTAGAIYTASAAALVAFIAVVLLFDLSWHQLWPLFLVIPGIAAVLARRTNEA